MIAKDRPRREHCSSPHMGIGAQYIAASRLNVRATRSNISKSQNVWGRKMDPWIDYVLCPRNTLGKILANFRFAQECCVLLAVFVRKTRNLLISFWNPGKKVRKDYQDENSSHVVYLSCTQAIERRKKERKASGLANSHCTSSGPRKIEFRARK